MLRIFSIPDPGSKRFRIPDPHQRILNPQKLFLSSRKYDPDLDFLIIPDPGGLKGTGSGIRTTDTKLVQGAEVKPGGRMFESSPVFHLGGLSEREQTIGLLERGTVVTRYGTGSKYM
jgi:hypothetical protein